VVLAEAARLRVTSVLVARWRTRSGYGRMAAAPRQGYPALLLPGYGATNVAASPDRATPHPGWPVKPPCTDPLERDRPGVGFAMTLSIIAAPPRPGSSREGLWPISAADGRHGDRVESLDGKQWQMPSWSRRCIEGPRPLTPCGSGTAGTRCSVPRDRRDRIRQPADGPARVRGKGTDFHFNHVRGWRVAPDGQISFYGET
jgi:hypothetical protein